MGEIKHLINIINIEYDTHDDLYYCDIEQGDVARQMFIADLIAGIISKKDDPKDFIEQREKLKNSFVSQILINNVIPLGKIYKN